VKGAGCSLQRQQKTMTKAQNGNNARKKSRKGELACLLCFFTFYPKLGGVP
jgi:hypothetical protein